MFVGLLLPVESSAGTLRLKVVLMCICKPRCSEVQSECHWVKRGGLPSLQRLQGQPASLPSLEAPWTPWLQDWEVQTSVFVISPPTPDAPASSQEV